MPKDADTIAIIGLAGRFPESHDLDAFWDHLRAGRECVHFFSDAELAALGWDAVELRAHGHVAARPRIADPELFDAEFFGYTADQAALIDPQQRLFLEVCWEAIENAGRNPRGMKERVGVFAGQSTGNYLLFNLASAGRLGAAEYFSTVVANGPDYLCSRVAFTCNLIGPCVTVQTACSTGIVALHVACQSLLNFECDVAVAGAVTLQLLPLPGHFYDGGKTIYSSDGHSRIFDEQATGTIFGDGCATVVLRRLEDALADGDPIRAVILGSAINNSGAVAAGFGAPSARAQEDVAAEAIAVANVSAESIGYLEIHGSGSTIGDAIEVSALTRAFRKTTKARGSCGLGAVKSNVGHLGAAAGMASLCKTVLALEHGEIPPTILVDRVNPSLALEQSPFHLVLRPEPFAHGRPRRAAVNSYGVGGTNAHVILEEAPAVVAGAKTTGPHALVLSAMTPSALRTASERLATYLQTDSDVDMADVAFTLATGRCELSHRRALVCLDAADAVAQLLAAGGEGIREASAPRVVLVLDPPAAADVSDCRALAQRWVTWGLDLDGVFAPGGAESVGRGLRIVPESAQGPAGLAALRARADVTLIDGWSSQAETLAVLGRLWVRGAKIEWPAVFGDGRRRVALPSYPFERKRHWIDLPAVGSGRIQPAGAQPLEATASERAAPVPPGSPIEATLCALWRDATGVQDAGVDDNFFALGGTSLQLAEVHARLRSTVLADLTVVDVFSNPTVRGLARQIARIQADPSLAGQAAALEIGGLMPPAGHLSQAEIDVLRSDARLADDIRPSRPRPEVEPEAVLLTGATGFLGVFLLKELLTQTRATIYCHVRAADRAGGFARIRTAMQSRDLWDDANANRVVPVCGDLGDDRLGLTPAGYAELSARIDTIVHNGATVKFTPPYASLKKVNVTGTEDILRLACDGRTKAVHFVSSIGVWAGRFPVQEDDPLDDIDGLENGYTQSKWVAERLVQAAGDRGLPITIHRPPRVVGDSRTGSANLDDFVARAIKGCAELGAAPDGHFLDILAPVDFVARAIVAISFSRDAAPRKRFHIVPSTLVTWRTILDFMKSLGIRLDTLPYPEWRERLVAYCQKHDNALKTLLPMFRPAGAGGFADIPLDTDLSLLPEVPCENAKAVLAGPGIECPPIDATLLGVYFKHFFDIGFLAKP